MMKKKIGLFYGTTTGRTESVAEMIKDVFGGDIVALHEISQAEPADFSDYEYLIIGSSTWNVGELQSDWEDFFEELDEIDFSGKKVAFFGVGDQVGYSNSFQDAMGILEEKISKRGAELIGYTSTDGYDFNESRAVRDGKFCGLAIDEDNQSDLTEERVINWVNQLKKELAL
ncbi:flavodoxin [Calothrix sp. NIES-3974]|nr:flavodoxin [Calothrix sp. NIES-3974]